MKKQIIVTCLAYMLLPQVAISHTQKNTGLWTSAVITGSFSDWQKWGYYLEPQLRFIDQERKLYQENLYLGLSYQTNPQLNFYAGVCGTNRYNGGDPATQEIRLWQRMKWDVIQCAHFVLTSRSQLEQRKRSSYEQIANRFRERLSFKFGNLILADEVFLQLNQPSWVSDQVFSENRASIGIEKPINRCTAYQFGYLNQYRFNQPDKMTNVIFLSLALNK